MNLIERVKRGIKGTFNFIKFIYFIQKEHLFDSDSPAIALFMLGKFYELQKEFYSQKVVFNRTPEKSSKLLQVLTCIYLDSKSSTTLDQIFSVIKEEFIKRETNGRKQFQIR